MEVNGTLLHTFGCGLLFRDFHDRVAVLGLGARPWGAGFGSPFRGYRISVYVNRPVYRVIGKCKQIYRVIGKCKHNKHGRGLLAVLKRG